MYRKSIPTNPPIHTPGTVLYQGNVLRVEEPCKPTNELDTKANLCDTCISDYPTCPSTRTNVVFGDGLGNDNVCKCSHHIKKEEVTR